MISGVLQCSGNENDLIMSQFRDTFLKIFSSNTLETTSRMISELGANLYGWAGLNQNS
jgi:succinate dehydrogenase flavin-adding protein (antitoxin of CptAB toxin-antitoxin module)